MRHTKANSLLYALRQGLSNVGLCCRGIELETQPLYWVRVCRFLPQHQSEKTLSTSSQRVVNLEAGFLELNRGRESAGGSDGKVYFTNFFVGFRFISQFCTASQFTLSQNWDIGFQNLVVSPLQTPSSGVV